MMRSSDVNNWDKVMTDDGSYTYVDSQGVSYKSLRGAAGESNHVFVQPTLRFGPSSGPVRILELGFGTGTNFEQTSRAFADRDLTYVSIDCQLLPPNQWLADRSWHGAVDTVVTNGSVSLKLLQDAWSNVALEGVFDAYFHDPFAPSVNPECWTPDCFAWAFDKLKDSGVMLTYGASTAARRAMRQVGFDVGILPGFAGKREMTIAAKDDSMLEGVKRWKTRD